MIDHFKEVAALDKEKPAKEFCIDIAGKFVFYSESFESFKFPKSKFDLINAQYSLPFMPKKNFFEVWPKIVEALKPGGIFVGQFFGVDDEWNKQNMTFLNSAEVEDLIEGFKKVEFKEEKIRKKLASGDLKNWHLFHLILEKI